METHDGFKSVVFFSNVLKLFIFPPTSQFVKNPLVSKRSSQDEAAILF